MEATSVSQDIQGLILEMRGMERRLASLEARMDLVSLPAANIGQQAEIAPVMAASVVSADVIPTFGRALLGIAGAYMLRALTEAGTLPRSAGVAAGIGYAALWLWFAVRTQEGRTLALAVNSVTSMMILVPVLWESTVWLHAISSSTAAWVLATFSMIGQAVSWRKNVKTLAGIVSFSCGLTGMTLLFATRDLLPFTAALLAIAAGVEFAACRDHAPGPRWLIALLADLSVVIFTMLIDSKGGLPDGYAPSSVRAVLAMQALLLLIYMTSTAARTLLQHREFTNFETVQSALAYIIGLGGMFQISKWSNAATDAIGLFALFCGLACYLISFVFLGREGKQGRNFYTYSTFAILTTLGGSFALLSGLGLVAVWCILALGCCYVGARLKEQVLAVHGGFSLLLASLASGVAIGTASLLFGDRTGAGSLATAGVIAIAASLCYSGCNQRLPALLVAVNLAWLLTGLATRGLAATLQTTPLATLGTAAITVVAAGIAWCGVKWRRPELAWVAYGLMAVGLYKLIVRDFPLTDTAHMVFSLLLYGGAMVLLPRILQKGTRASKIE